MESKKGSITNNITESDVCEILKKDLNHEEINMKLYKKAFTHKSIVKDHNQSNERLEYIGDAVLNLVAGEYLYQKYSNENEGFLTRVRTKLVNSENLASIAKKLRFNEFVMMNERAMSKNWNNNQRILEDCFESFIGALYLDKGFDFARQWILTTLNVEENEEETLKDTNYKDRFMKLLQQNGHTFRPEYRVFKEDGPDHEKIFTVQLYGSNMLLSSGVSNSKKKAEQLAAHRALEIFSGKSL